MQGHRRKHMARPGMMWNLHLAVQMEGEGFTRLHRRLPVEIYGLGFHPGCFDSSFIDHLLKI